ncbi:hypothetical protein DRO54_07415 [Candidatus Bathyarchaeota archaeon]|nr:MAG: hypothetical protein DRO54_07415 [Candidatus Bathyarchaeota archaeon]
MRSYRTVFKDETKLDIAYVPPRLVHREREYRLLQEFFRFALESPGRMSQRVLITGRIGTGKTALSQRFGMNIIKEAQSRRINLHYLHVNCRENRGKLFSILLNVLLHFKPNFPRRGLSSEELLHALMEVLDEENSYLILALDELESLISAEGAEPLYKLTRMQETRLGKPLRLSLICILRNLEYLARLDESTRSTLQRNIIHLEEYSKSQLIDIISERVEMAFREGTVPEETIEIIAELAERERGNARYAIELLWRAGKYADANELPEVYPECVRMASTSIYPTVRKDEILNLNQHQQLLLLAIARTFNQSLKAYATVGEIEQAYRVVCEEYGQKPKSHTQIWKYVKQLSAIGIIDAKISGAGQRGKTTLIGLHQIPAAELEKMLGRTLKFD